MINECESVSILSLPTVGAHDTRHCFVQRRNERTEGLIFDIVSK
jgi:hypothetical protein